MPKAVAKPDPKLFEKPEPKPWHRGSIRGHC